MTSAPMAQPPGHRYQAIISWLDAEGRVDVADLADRLGVAQETIRRDLRTLETEGKLQRVHGGAVALESGPLRSGPRLTADSEAAELARRTWARLPRTGTVLLDAGSLSLAVAQTIAADPPQERGLTIVTNALDAAIVLSRASRVSVYNIGGTVSPVNRAQEGDWALTELERLRVDVSVVCPAGMTVGRGFTQATPATAAVSQVEVDTGATVIALVSAPTVGVDSFVRFAGFDQVDEILVAGLPSVGRLQPFLDRGVLLQLPQPLA